MEILSAIKETGMPILDVCAVEMVYLSGSWSRHATNRHIHQRLVQLNVLLLVLFGSHNLK